MDYRETVNFLFEKLPMFTRIGEKAYKKDLDNIRHLCEKLGNPEKKFKSIHIAGTNGKGSTSHMLAAILQKAGYKTGLFTSPHIHDFRERIRINGRMISETDVMEFVSRIFPTENEPSFFEATVAMAFDHFATRQVDVAVVETGMGGRLDSTNIISPELSVITNIGRDHMQWLGDNLEAIAREKAGIIKPGTPVVIGETHFETLALFTETAKACNAPMLLAENEISLDSGTMQTQSMQLELRQVRTEKTYSIQLNMPGIYQTRNVRTVLCAAEQLRVMGWHIPDEAIREGLEETPQLTGLKGRWEIMAKEPTVIIDVAHNEDGLQRVMDQLGTQYRKSQKHFIIGFVRDKEVARMLRLFPQDARYYFTNAHIPRALPHTELKQLAMESGLKGESYSDINEALADARAHAEKDDVIMICGSFFILENLKI